MLWGEAVLLVAMNMLASLLNLGGPDLIVVAVIVLLLFGARKLPGLSRGLGEAMKEFSKAKDEFEGGRTRVPLTVNEWALAVLVPLGFVTAFSCLGVLTREEVLALLIVLLLIWAGLKVGGAP